MNSWNYQFSNSIEQAELNFFFRYIKTFQETSTKKKPESHFKI